MNYKKSFYNVEIDALKEDRKLVYNTYSGIYGIMDVQTQAVYYDIENIDSDFITDDEILKNVNIMAKAGYIIPSDKNELATIKFERERARYNTSTLTLSITPTMDCNMRCPYCFETRNNLVMSKETQEQVISFVKGYLNNNKNIKRLFVDWFGGEPLLYKDIVYSLSKQLIDICAEKDIAYSAGTSTNGSMLDVETARKLVDDCKLAYAQITIDGFQEIHNKRRILANGDDSYSIIMANIDACKDIIPIIVRVNVDKENLDEIERLVTYFLEEKGWTDRPKFYVTPVYTNDNTCGIDSSVCLQNEEFAQIYDMSNRAIYALNRDSVINNLIPTRKKIFCSAEMVSNFLIDPEGYIYNCHHHVGMTERRVGHITKPFVVN